MYLCLVFSQSLSLFLLLLAGQRLATSGTALGMTTTDIPVRLTHKGSVIELICMSYLRLPCIELVCVYTGYKHSGTVPQLLTPMLVVALSNRMTTFHSVCSFFFEAVLDGYCDHSKSGVVHKSYGSIKPVNDQLVTSLCLILDTGFN